MSEVLDITQRARERAAFVADHSQHIGITGGCADCEVQLDVLIAAQERRLEIAQERALAGARLVEVAEAAKSQTEKDLTAAQAKLEHMVAVHARKFAQPSVDGPITNLLEGATT